jgi:cytoskeleton protein RodZ
MATVGPAATPSEALPALTPQVLQDRAGTDEDLARIVLRATSDSWVEIRGPRRSVLVARLLKAGDSYRVPNQAELSLRTGNAGGLEITVDGNSVPPIGGMGMVRRNVALDPQALMLGSAVRD